MDPHALQQKIRTLIEPALDGLGFDLVAVELLGGRGRPLLRLSIDGPEGVSAADCALASEQLSPLLDANDPLPSAYTLEVSSPGIERPVQRIADFQRFRGYTVRVKLFEGPARRRYTGTIVSCDEDTLVLSVDGVEHALLVALVERAHLELNLEQYQRLGEGQL